MRHAEDLQDNDNKQKGPENCSRQTHNSQGEQIPRGISTLKATANKCAVE